MELDALKHRLARYFAHVPHVHAVGITTSYMHNPPRLMLSVVMGEETLDMPMSESADATERAQTCALRVGRVIGTRGVRTTVLTPAWRATHGLCEDDVILYLRPEADMMAVFGQVLATDGDRVYLHMQGTYDEEPEAWITRPTHLPVGALDGTTWRAHMKTTVRTFADLDAHPEALTDFVLSKPVSDARLDEIAANFAAKGL